MAERTILWKGQSGEEYKYWISEIDSTYKHVAGNYILVKETEPNTFNPLYIGESGDLADRLPGHEKWPCANSHGVTHVCSHTNNSGESVRRQEEVDLIAEWQPPCND